MLTATGFMVMCVAASSMCTADAVEMDHRHFDAAGRVRVLSRQRMHDRRAQRMLARRALAAAADRRLERDAVGRAEFYAAADGHVVDRNSGVLAEEIIGGLGNR